MSDIVVTWDKTRELWRMTMSSGADRVVRYANAIRFLVDIRTDDDGYIHADGTVVTLDTMDGVTRAEVRPE